ncbi:MAG TPA: LEA type 2 family protein [Gemmatimonadaceae bacterium]
MRKIALVAVAVVATVGAVAACASLGLGGFKDPVVTLKDVKVSGVGLTGGSVDIVMNVYNPNHFRLDATRMTYKLYVDTIPFGTGATDSRFTVQSGDSTEVRLPLSFSWSGIGRAGRELMNTGTVPYRVTGDITVGSSVGTFTLKYDRTGRYSALGGNTR